MDHTGKYSKMEKDSTIQTTFMFERSCVYITCIHLCIYIINCGVLEWKIYCTTSEDKMSMQIYTLLACTPLNRGHLHEDTFMYFSTPEITNTSLFRSQGHIKF